MSHDAGFFLDAQAFWVTPPHSSSLVPQLGLNTNDALRTSSWHAAQAAVRNAQTQECKLPLASPCTLAAPVAAEQQPLQRQGQGSRTAASGVLPIRCLSMLLLLTLRTLALC